MKKPLTRQALAMRKLVEDGKCPLCWQPNDSEASTCKKCRKKRNAARGCLKWRKGGAGRPPEGREIPWHTVDWTKKPKEIAKSLKVTQQAVYIRRKKMKQNVK